MKKNRPGTLVTVLAPPDRARRAGRRSCSARRRPSACATTRCMRECLRAREIVPVETPFGAGPVQDRPARRRVMNASPEFDDCVRARRASSGVPVKDVQAAAMQRLARADVSLGRHPESPKMSRFYLTTAIDYVNSRPHLGTAYEKITADVIARYKRLRASTTHFLMGNDEHSQNVFKRARELGEDPLAYCDRMETVFRDVWGRLTSPSTTSSARPSRGTRRGVQKLVRRAAGRTATSTRASTKAGTASPARRSSRRRISSTASAPCT